MYICSEMNTTKIVQYLLIDTEISEFRMIINNLNN